MNLRKLIVFALSAIVGYAHISKKPGFLRKLLVVTRRFSEKPGFWGPIVSPNFAILV